MERREFLGMAAAATLAQVTAEAQAPVQPGSSAKPMELGLVVVPYKAPEETIKRVPGLYDVLSVARWVHREVYARECRPAGWAADEVRRAGYDR